MPESPGQLPRCPAAARGANTAVTEDAAGDSVRVENVEPFIKQALATPGKRRRCGLRVRSALHPEQIKEIGRDVMLRFGCTGSSRVATIAGRHQRGNCAVSLMAVCNDLSRDKSRAEGS